VTERVRPVLFASEYHPPFAPGGAEWTNLEWAKALARSGQPVVIVTPNYGAARRESAPGVELVRVPFPLKLGQGQKRTPGLVHRNPLWDLYFGLCVAWVAYRHGVRVIHAQSKGALVGCWLAGRALGRPVLVTVRDVGLVCPLGHCPLFEPWTSFDCSARQYVRKCVPFHLEHYHGRAGRIRRAWLWLSVRLYWLDHLVRRNALARVDAVVGVSQRILTIHPERIVPPERRHVVHSLPPRDGDVPAVPDAARVRRQLGIADGPLVLYVGKLSTGKGTSVLLAALDRIKAAAPGARFAFAGRGELTLPIRDDVYHLGELPHASVLSLYGAADVVVSPSVWPEPLSRVIIEAMHCGRPVVATDVGGSSEAVEHDVTGLLVPANDASALADAIIALLRDPVRRERMGTAARTRLTAVFGEDRIVSSLRDVYAAASRGPA
jgi:glycosyltransferase involved in cell wall biosynthesis